VSFFDGFLFVDFSYTLLPYCNSSWQIVLATHGFKEDSKYQQNNFILNSENNKKSNPKFVIFVKILIYCHTLDIVVISC